MGLDGGRVVVTIGRNRQAKIPADRVVLNTGLTDISDAELDAIADGAASICRELDLEETWSLLSEEQTGETVDEIGSLHFGGDPSPKQLLGLAMRLEESSDRFTRQDGLYFARSPDEVRQIQLREERRRQAEESRARVMAELAAGRLPKQPSESEREVIEQLRSFGILGDESSQAKAARSLVKETFPDTADLQRRAFDLLAGAGYLSQDEPFEIERAGLPVEFSEAALAAASAPHGPQADPGRRDITDTVAITIDHADTLDRDDALSAEMLSEGRIRIGIHIADAGALVPVGGDIDLEAYGRMATLYTPETRIPMIPKALSEGHASIAPGQSRRAVTVLATIADGKVVDWEMFRSWIRSSKALCYEEADSILLAGTGEFFPQLKALVTAAGQLRARRVEAGAIALERPEISLKIADRSTPRARVSVTVLPRSTPARQAVMEMMVLCNRLMAEFCVTNSIPAAYRVQPQAAPVPMDLSDDYNPVAHYQFMRSTRPAEISTSPGRHHGLGVAQYLQATSPIRRYLDLMMHRQITALLGGDQPPYPEEAVSALARRADIRIGELSSIEGQRRRYWILRYLSQRAAEGRTDYDAVALDTERRGPALLELAEFPFRVRAWLTGGVGAGDTLTLRLSEVDLWRREAHFAPLQ